MPPWLQLWVVEMLLKEGIEPVIGWIFRDLKPRKGPLDHFAELKNEEPIRERVRKTSLRNNIIV